MDNQSKINFTALVDESLPDQHAIGELMFGLKREDMQKADPCTSKAQERYQDGKTTIAEFTSEMLACATTLQEALYLSQITGAQIYAVKIRKVHNL